MDKFSRIISLNDGCEWPYFRQIVLAPRHLNPTVFDISFYIINIYFFTFPYHHGLNIFNFVLLQASLIKNKFCGSNRVTKIIEFLIAIAFGIHNYYKDKIQHLKNK